MRVRTGMSSITTSKAKIALFLPSLHGGGAERVLVSLAQGFAERGLTVDLVLARAEGAYLSLVPPEVRVVDLGASRILTSLPALVSYLRRERPAILLSALEHANIVALWAKQISLVSTRVAVSVHSTLTHTAQGKTSRDNVTPFLVRLFYPWAETVIAVSKGVAADLVRISTLSPENVRVIYNPVVIPEILSKAQEPVAHHWFAPGEQPVILAAGRLTAAKDFRTLIKAFDQVRRERAARLLILGEGEERASLEELVRELDLEKDIELLGFVENPFAYMRRAAVFVLSSRWEGFGNVLVEAMASGCPVVSTDCPGGPAEILDGGRFGPLVQAGDPTALSKNILAVLTKPLSADILRQRAMDFALDKIAGEYLEVLCGTASD
ncbi:MAG: N-acetylgalactosamine-N,N'-diacetylbacillosaminyl-diphospho-undecaprenol 4-alpha-N-acetylgalactosaminyltransferase [Syntrophomonadaceae bacterium]|nr:N-acetylgalactosamine-N,N'-diacetylbacillosaminyl-diphospho-undecaprenol 4-alpha-N-acetylgalactosaminyltransferase [Bacillota bacterium]